MQKGATFARVRNDSRVRIMARKMEEEDLVRAGRFHPMRGHKGVAPDDRSPSDARSQVNAKAFEGCIS